MRESISLPLKEEVSFKKVMFFAKDSSEAMKFEETIRSFYITKFFALKSLTAGNLEYELKTTASDTKIKKLLSDFGYFVRNSNGILEVNKSN